MHRQHKRRGSKADGDVNPASGLRTFWWEQSDPRGEGDTVMCKSCEYPRAASSPHRAPFRVHRCHPSLWASTLTSPTYPTRVH
ncbi:hypothetical protein SCLCIDRAFT_1215775 [Scleroderma citrinum Foug A]|uniref:Uncharacterized protein n=1 Tax=Scleroderma citrinum Foug A TaxID=1036808 RepID=A0A0C2ZJC6_9AGAM|nr:hypothetical protein SCLCIDRAFT_1215775 [Scleroderma citrinum Foug A]